ncbi:tRNA uridine-5-carboxymethylaminomethyl(34) synthesis GTPase MnmE [Sedimentibacter hydroxybenzoicus DSM 7310]|uniref:tRNA modification GTPase MnmE n=1 Tax=Sedimentibacter hydroxybenzoicus DSM 7310 TaxID=1123245 RepID=A0A974BLJ0_SEDHY|nr:tRNA uridine-5-carboxymethylaminomethyl(34) synthesis GTPase MnmE [Sedimentibacter hydroxybenzoicus]NYB75454.1 tRNA uridine-5-carboxymethylaminomethyl(34) synthesis GTPase MnmE [Sedimentibacter hydroxybenzoicus DSM 7310]
MNTDTIAAIATFLGNAGINIIRISGNNALDIAKKIFVKNGKNDLDLKPRYLHYGHIVDDNNKVIDEVLISYMKAPNTYTKENIIEINCHGGLISAKKILETVLLHDCRAAERGEFTKRAFLNGRIDLAQAEAVIDIINSKTDSSHEISVNHLEGRLSREINEIIEEILDLLANIEVNIDFPEYDEDEVTINKVKELSESLVNELDRLIKTADTGKIFKEGIKTVILGKPNVGKSSLMNFLLNENRAIVTEIPGTTRDTIEEYVNIKGVPLRIIDTAGIRDTDDKVEKIGVEKALSKVDEADLVIMVFDSSTDLEEDDEYIINYVKNKKVVYISNKTDLPRKLNLKKYENIEKELINISILKNQGLEEIINKVNQMFFEGSINISDELIINNVRHKNLLIKAKNSLKEVLNSINNQMTIDFIDIDLKQAMESLGLIVGKTVSDDLMDKIFNEFCIGK